MEAFRIWDVDVRGDIINEKPYFVFKDICNAIEIGNSNAAINNIPSRYLVKHEVSDPTGRVRLTWMISEPGLYRFLARSNMPKAEPFQDWLFEEVLPQMRQYYATLGEFITSAPRDYKPIYDAHTRMLIRSSGWLESEFYTFLYQNGYLPANTLREIKKFLKRRYLYGRMRWVWISAPTKEVMLHQFLKDRGLELNQLALGELRGLMLAGKKKNEQKEIYLDSRKAIAAIGS